MNGTVLLIGGSAALATLDGGLSRFILTAALGYGAYKGAQTLTSSDLRKVRAGIIERLAKLPKDEVAQRALLIGLKAKIESGQEAIDFSSALVGVATVLCPILGLSALTFIAIQSYRRS